MVASGLGFIGKKEGRLYQAAFFASNACEAWSYASFSPEMEA